MTAVPQTLPGRTRIVLADGESVILRARHGWCLAAITVLAAALRLYGIGEWSLWIDEAHTWRDATMPLGGKDGFLATERTLYGLTFFLLRGLFALGLPETEAAMRLPFVVLGIATVPLLGVAGRRLVGATASVFAAGLLAIDPWHVYWSQNARGYVVVVAAAVVVANRLFAYVRHDRYRDVLLAWGAILIGTLSHTTGGLLALGLVAFLWLRRQTFDRRRVQRIVVVVAATAFVIWWAVKFWLPFEGFLKSKDSPSLPHFVQTAGYYFRPVALVLAAVGVWQLAGFGGRDRALLLASMSLVSFAVMLLVGTTIVLVTARYAIAVLPAVTWLAAFAVVHLAEALGRAAWAGRSARFAAVALLPLLVLAERAFALVDYYGLQHGQRAQWREAAAFVRERAAGRPIRVATISHATLFYYLRFGQWRNRVAAGDAANRVVPLEDWMVREGKDETKRRVCDPGALSHFTWHRREAAAQGAHFAVVVTMPELAGQDPDHSIRDAIAQQCELVLHLPCWVGPKDESIYVYEWKQP